MTKQTANSCDSCDKECKDHSLNVSRIKTLEEKLTVVEQNTATVNKLTSKVSLLLTIMTAIVVIVSGGAIYTFTGLNDFKDTYSNDRIALHEKITESQDKNRELLEVRITNLQDNLDHRMDNIEHNMEKIERSIENIKK